jgi:tungstate transport system substrate-binding protein
MIVRAIIAILSMCFTSVAFAQSPPRYITVASTHTTQDSGLLDELAPRFTEATGIGIRFVISGTGQALDVGRRGDADVILSHVRAEEERLVADGFGVERLPVMYNDFVLVGPSSDPARVREQATIAEALRVIRQRGAPFISRGDRSGTHVMELSLWQRAGIDVKTARGEWYREIGQGMGAALNMASALDAYVLSDRGTWLNFRNRGQLAILSEGDQPLRNQYGVILVNPERHPTVKAADGLAFVNWLTGPMGQKAIASYKINGQQVFYPNAGQPGM